MIREHIDKLQRVLGIDRGRAIDYAAEHPLHAQSVIEQAPDEYIQPGLMTFDDMSCEHRGDVVESRDCPVCGDETRTEDVAECEVHGLCSMRAHGRRFADVQSCFHCPDCHSSRSPGP